MKGFLILCAVWLTVAGIVWFGAGELHPKLGPAMHILRIVVLVAVLLFLVFEAYKRFGGG